MENFYVRKPKRVKAIWCSRMFNNNEAISVANKRMEKKNGKKIFCPRLFPRK